jgi:Domain of unknown function (DUF5134)
MVGAPSGLYYLFAVVMLSVALYGLALFVVSAVERSTGGRDVELSHVAMGVAMSGMFVPGWSFGPNVLWELIFAAFLVWFVVRTVQSVQAWGLHVPHTAIHAVMSFGMLLMYWFPLGSTSGAMAMSTSAASGRMDPGLALLIAFVLFGSAVFTIASPNKGATHFGTHCGPRATVAVSDGRGGVAAPAAPTRLTGILAAPSLLDASHVVMCVGMGLMLILMI